MVMEIQDASVARVFKYCAAIVLQVASYVVFFKFQI